MDNIAGAPVEGRNFFGRELEVTRLTDILGNDDILLLGPRRIGKTSIARAVMQKVRADGWRSIEINVASCIDERGFLEKLDTALRPELASLGSKVSNTISAALASITSRIKSIKLSVPGVAGVGVEIVGDTTEEWTKVGCEVLQLIAQVEQRWLIYIDELPIMLFNIMRADPVTGVQRVRRFLDWFRNDVRGLPGAQSVRWLVSGSIGLDTLVQQHGMADTINSLSHQGLPAFKDEVAVDMLMVLAGRYQMAFHTEDARSMVDAIKWSQPYYLQTAFHHLRSLMAASPGSAASTLIDAAIETMVQPGSDNDFHHWISRLEQQLDRASAGHAIALLNFAANDALGVRPEALLHIVEERLPGVLPEDARRIFINLRDILERDAYWWPDENSGNKRYRFRLEPLRRWWMRRNTL